MSNDGTPRGYIHGTSDREQTRLVRQAEILRPILLAGLGLAVGVVAVWWSGGGPTEHDP